MPKASTWLRASSLEPRAAMVYASPSHQYPLGVTMSLSRRLALLEWARTAGAWVLEDDYDSEYRYAGRPLAALQGLDSDGRVIYLGTFSKVMLPSLRLGYLVLPPDLVDAFVAARAIADRHSPSVDQAALADFIEDGQLERHIRRMRMLYADRQAALIDAARRELGGLLDLTPSEAGMHLVGWLPRRRRRSRRIRCAPPTTASRRRRSRSTTSAPPAAPASRWATPPSRRRSPAPPCAASPPRSPPSSASRSGTAVPGCESPSNCELTALRLSNYQLPTSLAYTGAMRPTIPLLEVTRHDVSLWFQDHGTAVVGTLAFVIIASMLIRRVVPRALRPAITRQMAGRPEVEVERRVETLSSVILRTAEIVLFALRGADDPAGVRVRYPRGARGRQHHEHRDRARRAVARARHLNGIFILSENQYARGDIVTLAGVTGTVEDVSLRRTIVRDIDGVHVHDPERHGRRRGELHARLLEGARHDPGRAGQRSREGARGGGRSRPRPGRRSRSTRR